MLGSPGRGECWGVWVPGMVLGRGGWGNPPGWVGRRLAGWGKRGRGSGSSGIWREPQLPGDVREGPCDGVGLGGAGGGYWADGYGGFHPTSIPNKTSKTHSFLGWACLVVREPQSTYFRCFYGKPSGVQSLQHDIAAIHFPMDQSCAIILSIYV